MKKQHIKTDFQEIKCKVTESDKTGSGWSHMRASVNTEIDIWGSVRGEIFLDQLNKYQFFKKDGKI
jgi:hypothetical protein